MRGPARSQDNDRMKDLVKETYTRIFVDTGELESAVSFYQALLAGEESLRFDYPEKSLKLAAVSSPHLSVLIIAGPADKRAPFEATRLTIKVRALEPAIDLLQHAGAEQLEPIAPTPTGRKTRFRHADGLIVEYVDHHDKQAARVEAQEGRQAD